MLSLSNMNSRMREMVYGYLKMKYGAKCNICKKLESEVALVVDHVDNNNNNNSSDNFQLLCRACNYKKNPRLAERQPLDSVGVCTTFQPDVPTEIKINREKEPKFREYIEQIINKYGEWEKSDLIYSGAERMEISPKTATKYLKKMCSSGGKYQIIKKNKMEYVVKRDKILL